MIRGKTGYISNGVSSKLPHTLILIFKEFYQIRNCLWAIALNFASQITFRFRNSSTSHRDLGILRYAGFQRVASIYCRHSKIYR